MAAEALARKLRIAVGSRALVLGAPPGYASSLAAAAGAEVDEEAREESNYDVVQAFVKDRLDVEREAARALRALKPGGVLWFSYPKTASGVASELTRDRGWDVVARAGLRPVSQVSVDEVWSALRFRPGSDVGSGPP